MNESTQTILVVLAALLVGALVPLIAQLFLAARSLRRVLSNVDRRLGGTLDELSEAVSALKSLGAPTTSLGSLSTLTSLGSALAPAVIAAVQAFREQMAAPEVAAPNGHARSRAPEMERNA